MIALLVSALTLGRRIDVPLHLDPGFRTFPEIAALVGETPTEVKCDPGIARRMVFVSAKAISREGLLTALGLTLVPDGKRRLMKDADAKIEREWASRVRDSLARRSERTFRAAIDAIGTGVRSSGDQWYVPFRKVLSDPKATAAERAKADMAWFDAFGAQLTGDGRLESIAAQWTLAAFPSSVPVELLERGRMEDTLPTGSLPAATLAALRRAYPTLRGGPGSIVVRRRILGEQMGTMGLWIRLGVVDPGIIVAPAWGASVSPAPMAPEPTLTGTLLRADAERVLLLRTFRETLAAIRATEAPGRTLVDAYAKEIPPTGVPGATSLSQIVEAWAKGGHDVIQELDPSSEDLTLAFDRGRLRADGDWSPGSVEGVLVLRPLLRFVTARRRFPLAALRALEASGEQPKRYVYSLAPTASLAGLDLYGRAVQGGERWGFTNYRGWDGFSLDGAARRSRILDLIPPAVRSEAERVLRTKAKGPPADERPREMGPVAGTWKIRLADLTPSAREAIAATMRAGDDDGEHGNVAAHSPAALAYILREGWMEVSVRDSLAGYTLSCFVWADLTPLGTKGPGPSLAG